MGCFMRVLLLIRKENSDYNIANYKRAIKMFCGKVVTFKDGAFGELLMRRLKKIDAILLPGGECTTKWDKFLISFAIKNNKRLLGICQGMQEMGKYGSDDKLLECKRHALHDGSKHLVYLNDGILKRLGGSVLLVNSYHREKLEKSSYFRITGISVDGVIEAIEGDNFMIGVQWHPEKDIDDNIFSQKLFKLFVTGNDSML